MTTNDTDMTICTEAMKTMKTFTESCRTWAMKSETMMCKATFWTMTCWMEACMKTINTCMETTRKGGDTKTMHTMMMSQ
jgi:hypothetical protein